MTYSVLRIALFTLASSAVVGQTSYGSDLARTESQKEAIDEAINANEGAGKRIEKRQEARDLQKKGKKAKQAVQTASKPMKYLAKGVGIAAKASGDPQAKMAAIVFKLAVEGVLGLGTSIGTIIEGVGRYQERSQAILSNAELLLEQVLKSLAEKENLEKAQQELLKVDKPLESSQNASTVKKLAVGAANVLKTAEIKARQATDVFTDEKAKREEKLKALQAKLKVVNDEYDENIRLLQILLMQDTIREIDKKIDIDATIETLETNVKFFETARNTLSKNKSKRKKQLAKIEEDEETNNKDLLYYSKFKNSPSETPQQLEKARAELLKKSDELTALTKRGDTLYLQNKDVLLDTQLNRTAIVTLYKEVDALKNQVEDLAQKLSTPRSKPLPATPLKNDAVSQQKALDKAVPNQASQPTLQERILAQRETLRKTGQ